MVSTRILVFRTLAWVLRMSESLVQIYRLNGQQDLFYGARQSLIRDPDATHSEPKFMIGS